MTGPAWLATIIIVSTAAGTLAAIYTGPCVNGAEAARNPGTLRLPPKGLARFFYLLSFRIIRRQLTS